MSIHDSTETFRRKATPIVEEIVSKSMDDHMEETRILQSRQNGMINDLQTFQKSMIETIIGTLPPDPSKPSLWQSLQEMILWKKGVNKVLWVACTASISALVAVIWKIVLSGPAQ